MTDLKDPRKQKNVPGTWSNILKSENELPSGLLNSAVGLLKQLHGISKMHKKLFISGYVCKFSGFSLRYGQNICMEYHLRLSKYETGQQSKLKSLPSNSAGSK
jgi:hypothetical protein